MGMVHYMLLSIFLILPFISMIMSSLCNHLPLNISEIFTGIKIDHPLIKIKNERPPFSNIRIHFEYTESYTSYHNSETIKNEVLLPSKAILESLILVKNPINGILRVDRACKGRRRVISYWGEIGCADDCEETKCADVTVPPKFLKRCKYVTERGHFALSGAEGEGVIGIDIAIIVVVKNCDGNTLATAASCFHEDQLDRPILGVLIICNGKIKAGENIRTSIAIIKHEVVHTLGFSSDKYAFYRHGDGTPRVRRDSQNMPINGYDTTLRAYRWNNQLVKRISRHRFYVSGRYRKNVYAFTLPTVLDVARKHFNCPTLDGVDLEASLSLSHFSEYVLYNELMTPEANDGMTKLSKFTLALLKDTGWYDVKLDEVNDFHFNEKKGCNIILQGCYKYISDQKAKGLSISPFCDKPMDYGNIFECSENRKYFYYCDLSKKKSLSPKYQYFKSLPNIPDEEAQLYSGSSIENEYCPSRLILSNPSSICDDVNNDAEKNDINILNSYYGKDSACFENGIWNHASDIYFGASCQKFYIDDKSKMLTVYFKTKTVDCPTTKIHWFAAKYGYTASFTCPNMDKLKMLLENRNGSNVTATTIKIFYLIIVVFYLS